MEKLRNINLENLFFSTAKVYAFIYFYVRKITGLKIRGLGVLLRKVKKPKIIKYKNKKIYVNPKVISSYGISIINKSQEKETEIFLDKIMKELIRLDRNVDFIDVGSNIGIFLLQMSNYKNIRKLIGFDPAIGCVEAATRTLEINKFNNFKIFNNLVGSVNKNTLYSNDIDPQGASIYKSKNNENSIFIKQVRLDDIEEIKNFSEKNITIMLIDVEGYEPEVIKGGLEMIIKKIPLIIFEYNTVSKKYFKIEQIYSLLGSKWEIFRLKKDGKLDKKVENTWNCVAINKNSIFPNLFKVLNLYS